MRRVVCSSYYIHKPYWTSWWWCTFFGALSILKVFSRRALHDREKRPPSPGSGQVHQVSFQDEKGAFSNKSTSPWETASKRFLYMGKTIKIISTFTLFCTFKMFFHGMGLPVEMLSKSYETILYVLHINMSIFLIKFCF